MFGMIIDYFEEHKKPSKEEKEILEKKREHREKAMSVKNANSGGFNFSAAFKN